jgi:hypothetical protein
MEKEYKRICPRCNKELNYSSYKTHHQAVKRNSICKSCRTSIANMSPKRDSKLAKNPMWKGIENIPYKWFSSYFERGTKKRTGNITIEQMYKMWIDQNKKCNLSGVPIGFNDSGKYGSTCSIDRIDSLKEYTIDNVQLVHKDVNLMKNKFDQDYFIEMCKKIAGGACEINI